MANLYQDSQFQIFRFVSLIDNLNESQLENEGYYHGYPCPHGHTIRDIEQHWCYHCARKIASNVCGFDVNYLHKAYKVRYASLWRQIDIGLPQDCWEIQGATERTPKRICIPSYRSDYSKQKSENVNIHKALYQCAWGDVGSLLVTRMCGNPKCGNPLHMVSSLNVAASPPQSVTPLEIDFKAEKLMLFNRQDVLNQQPEKIVEQSFKRAITNPLYAKEPPDYDEG